MNLEHKVNYWTASIPGVPFTFKEQPEDFKVTEIPLYPPSGTGEHLYLSIEKTGLSTHDMLNWICHSTGIAPVKIGIAGQKDKKATTIQNITIHTSDESILEHISSDKIKILNVSRHSNKIKLGHLKGNQFEICLKNINPQDFNFIEQTLQLLSQKGLPNFFGEQRFGLYQDNAERGKQILLSQNNYYHNSKIRFLISAYQSYLFNQALNKRLPHLDIIWQGDLAYKHINGACFTVESSKQEQPRADQFEISPSGPIFGYKMSYPDGPEKELEVSILQNENLTLESLASIRNPYFKGARRPYRIPLQGLEYMYQENTLLLKFILPPGSYATTLLREIGKEYYPASQN